MNRNDAVSEITTLNVPTVTNAIMNEMLNDTIIDNVAFKEDYAGTQTIPNTGTTGGATLDFSSYDRIDLTHEGGDTGIAVSGMSDGETKWVILTKTTGTSVSFSGITDITTSQGNVDSATKVLYQIVRKGTSYYALAWVSTPNASLTTIGVSRFAVASEAQAITSQTLGITPYTLGLTFSPASAGEVAAGTDTDVNGTKLFPQPSQLKTTNDNITALENRTHVLYAETTTGQNITNGSYIDYVITHNQGTTSYQVMASIYYPVGAASGLTHTVVARAVNSCTIRVFNNIGSLALSVVVDAVIIG